MRQLVVAVIAMLSFAGNKCSAELILNFGTAGQGTSGIKSSFDVAAGSSLFLNVWLTQTGTYQPVPGIFIGDYRLSNDPSATADGLGSYFVDVGSNNPSVNPVRPFRPDPVNFPNVYTSATTYGPGFLEDAGAFTNQPNGNLLRIGGIAAENPADAAYKPIFVSETFVNTQTPNNGSVANNSILLATIKVDIASNASGSAVLTGFSPYSPIVGSNGNLLYFGLGSNPLAPLIVVPTSSIATLQISAVPEPTTWLFATGAIAFVAQRLRYRRTKTA